MFAEAWRLQRERARQTQLEAGHKIEQAQLKADHQAKQAQLETRRRQDADQARELVEGSAYCRSVALAQFDLSSDAAAVDADSTSPASCCAGPMAAKALTRPSPIPRSIWTR